ncbi:MAG: hypothetical protein NZ740_03380 [Kiritimatiellae bacterium]|nr:hypothetical protein [Kiritimatiellia bacterium]MDW8458133.1 hypothetical protein [Verrucomicrobiota bacterium]
MKDNRDSRRIAVAFPSGIIYPTVLGSAAAVWVLAQSPFSPLPGRDASALTGYAGYQIFRPLGTPIWGSAISLLSFFFPSALVATVTLQAILAGATAAFLNAILWNWQITKASESVDAHARRSASIFGTLFWIASPSFVLTFSYPRAETLALALLAAAVFVFQRYLLCGGRTLLLASGASFGLSATDHAAAALLLPIAILAAATRASLRRETLWRDGALLALAAGIAFAMVVLPAIRIFLSTPAAAWREADSWMEAVRLFWQEYMARGPQSIPKVGWLAIFALAFVPLPFLSLPVAPPRPDALNFGPALFRFIALPVIASVILLNFSGAPLRIAQTDSALPLVYFVAALWAGRLWGQNYAWLAMRLTLRRKSSGLTKRQRTLYLAWLAAGLLLCAAAASANRPTVASEVASAARALAETIVSHAPENAIVATTGELDDHLIIAASHAAKPIRFVNVRAATRLPYLRHLASIDPTFDPGWVERAGLEPVLSQWLEKTSAAGIPCLAVAPLDMLAPPHQLFRPDLFAYRLAPSDQDLDVSILLETADRLDRIAPIQIPPDCASPAAANFARWFNRYMGRLANEVGVEWNRLHRSDEALRAFSRALEFDPDNPVAHINRLLLLQRMGKPPEDKFLEQARAVLGRFAGHGGGLPFQAAFGRVAISEGQITPVFPPSSLEPSAEHHPLDAYTRLLAEGRHQEARARLDALLEADPANTLALRERIAWHLRDRKFDAARADLRALQKQGAAVWQIQALEGELLLAEGRLEEAAEHFRALLLKYPSLPEAALGQATALGRLERLEEWRKILPDLDRLSSNHPPSLRYLAQNAAANRDWSRARQYLESCRVLEPLNAEVLEALIHLDFTQRDAQGLEEHGAALLQLHPHHPLGWYAVGTSAAWENDWEHAARAFEMAASRAPSVSTLNDWGWALHQIGRHEEALSKLDEALQFNPDAARTWATRGLVALHASRPSEAVSNLLTAITKGSDSPDVWDALARAYESAGNRDEAERIRREKLK